MHKAARHMLQRLQSSWILGSKNIYDQWIHCNEFIHPQNICNNTEWGW